jgi:L-alanine-DL-glutamate epimerase-like enolase superfamily enzyme
MNIPLKIRKLRAHRLAIPMRLRFEHAAASRAVADPVIVELNAGAPYAHHVGYGETLARPYVSGETVESVVEDVMNLFAPRLRTFQPDSFAAALEAIDALPVQVGGRVVTAARCAVELALLDLCCAVFDRRPADVAGWMGLIGFGPPGCLARARYSGMVIGKERKRIDQLLRVQRWYGLRDFKLKVAVPGWEERLRWAHARLHDALLAGQVTLRVDANGGWSLADAHAALPLLEDCGVSAIEQPLSDAADEDLPYLARQTRCDLIADESLLTAEDAQRLIGADAVRVLNVRIAKNGGLLPALRIARHALAAGRDVQLGCLVGETSILAAAGVHFLLTCPAVRFVEGAFGRLLLRGDVTRRTVRFGCGGRIRPPAGPGLGVAVEPRLLERYAAAQAVSLRF